MTHRFTEKERTVIRNNFFTSPIFRLVDTITRRFEPRLQNFSLWSEELFFECSSILDDIKENGDDYFSVVPSLWKRYMSQLRSIDTSIPTDELILTVSIILESPVLVLQFCKDATHRYIGQQILNEVCLNRTDWEDDYKALYKSCLFLSDAISSWCFDYFALSNNSYISDNIEDLLRPSSKKNVAGTTANTSDDNSHFIQDPVVFASGKEVTSLQLTWLYQNLCKFKWIDLNTSPDSFTELFAPTPNKCTIKWVASKSCLKHLFEKLVENRYLLLPNGYEVNKILENHFLDKKGHFMYGLRGATSVAAKDIPKIDYCLSCFKCEVKPPVPEFC